MLVNYFLNLVLKYRHASLCSEVHPFFKYLLPVVYLFVEHDVQKINREDHACAIHSSTCVLNFM